MRIPGRYPSRVYPHGRKWQGVRPDARGFHTTSGLGGNVALDFMAPGGTWVVAPEDATVVRWSGHDPAEGEIRDSNGRPTSVYAWSMYLQTRTGHLLFLTHLQRRFARPGQVVRVGEQIGTVAAWPNNPGRSHTHLGVTHRKGVEAGRAWLLSVANAPRVEARGPERPPVVPL